MMNVKERASDVAQQTTIVDDLDGSSADETIRFSIDGASYEIDLNAEHAEELRETLGPWIGHARQVGGRSPRTRRPASRASARRGGGAPGRQPSTQEVRAWAREQGIPVSERGRIPASLVESYLAQH